jgi:hypothetical protein
VRAARTAATFPASVPEAEALWYDTARWADWVDGLARVVVVRGDWPEVGATVSWESGPAGRGQVTETVIAHRPGAGQTLEVTDDAIRGRQQIAFAREGAAVGIELSLAYEIRRRTPLTPIVDLLFIRRAMVASLDLTLTRFGAHLQGEAHS